MDTLARPIVSLYELSKNILATSIKDLSDEDARARMRAGAGPSIAWTIGHLCHHKVQALQLLGQSRDNPFSALFENVPASDGANYPTLTELMASFSTLHAAVCGVLATASAQLESRMPGAGPHDEQTVLDRILFLAWHEAYHIGSIGAIRKELGRAAIADLVVAQ